MESINNPLVTVCVFTFNSASTVEQTLESVFSQSYKNIELVISDDCSVDSTIQVCNSWVEKNGERFNNVQVLTVEENTGTTKNVNRGYRAATGEWLKPMSGDDLLKVNAIETLVDYCIKNSKDICISKVDFFGDESRITQKIITYDSFFKKYHKLTTSEKYNLLLHECVLPTPSMLVSKSLVERIGYLDESYSLYEEWPFLLKILEIGVDIPYIEDKLICYRCENNSLSSTQFNSTKKGETYKSARYRLFQDGLSFYNNCRKPILKHQHRYFAIWDQNTYYKIFGIMNIPNRTLIQKFKLFLLRIVAPGTYFNAYMYFKTSPKKQLLVKIKKYLKF